MEDIRLMSRKFITEFIELYRMHECLWKIKSKEYSDKRKKHAAYNVLIEKLKEIYPQANRDMVVKKINSLRTCFRKELNKYKASINLESGEEGIYKPKLWYFDLLLFVSDQEIPSQHAIEEIIGSPKSENEGNVKDNDEAESATSSYSSVFNTFVSRRPPLRTFKKKKIDRSEEVLKIIAASMQPNEPIGMYESFGKHIGQELEEMSPEMAIYCKKIINDAIYNAQLGHLTQHSRIVNAPEE